MSKTGALARGVYALISFLLHSAFRVGVNVGLVATVVMTLYAVGVLSKEAIKERKEVLDLIYWRDPKKSVIALSLTLLALFIFAKFSLISVLAYTGLAVLAGTFGFRLYKAVEGQIKKTSTANPFQPYLDQELAVPQDRVHAQVDVLVEHGQMLAKSLRRLFLVEDILDTVKFGLLLWAFTYIGGWFSGLTLVILIVLGVFSIPKFYEVYQEPIDAQLAVVHDNIKKVTDLIYEKLPFLKRVTAAAEKKDQ